MGRDDELPRQCITDEVEYGQKPIKNRRYPMDSKREYDVALSFAGEDRAYVEMVAEQLKARGVSVFYDKDEEADLWGKDLYVHLTEVYSQKARYIVMFCSHFYAAKLWTTVERKAAQARAFQQVSEYILPVKLDDTDIPGMLPTTGYLDLRTRSPLEVAIKLCEKLGRNPLKIKADQTASPVSPSHHGEVSFNYSNHNGKYRIGKGVCEFETHWSKGSKVEIVCYNDFIRGVALVPKEIACQDLNDVSQFDFTSRTRRPQVGQCVVLQNHHGVYALLQILEIRDDKRGDPQDLLRFRYWINESGSADLSHVDIHVETPLTST